TSRVKVQFKAQNGTNPPIIRNLYLKIDNTHPSLSKYDQNLNFFNPTSTNFDFSKIVWDLLPSEICVADLEIYQNSIEKSQHLPVTDNTFDDSKPEIFLSNTGELYMLYESYESGRYIIYITKSVDNGISWNNPVEITRQTEEDSEYDFKGASWGDIVLTIVEDPDYNIYNLHRSFDKGINFVDIINLTSLEFLPADGGIIFDMEFTNNGTLYITYKSDSDPYDYYVYKSTNLGLNWTLSGQWKENDDFGSQTYCPTLTYDSANDLLHLLIPSNNRTGSLDPILQFHVFNFTIVTLNLSTNTWASPVSSGYLNYGTYTGQPDLLIKRNTTTSSMELEIIYQYEVAIIDGELKLTYHKITSNDSGKTWYGPYNSSISTPEFATDYEQIYYADVTRSGADRDITLVREGGLIKSEHTTITTYNVSNLVFDGINDYGQLISEGDYTYKITFKDDAGNKIERIGGFYVDYHAPDISNLANNWSINPIPRYDVNISVHISDTIGFSAYLYYKKDLGNWQVVPMDNSAPDLFCALIPGDSETDLIQYFVKAIDLAGNEHNLDREGLYYTYDLPRFKWSSEGLFDDTESYNSGDEYPITIQIEQDLEYVEKVIFRYSYDEGDSWTDLQLKQNSPEFKGTLEDLPGDLREMYYQIIIVDVFGNEIELQDSQKIEFYPEVPGVDFNAINLPVTMIIAALVGFVVAYGYIRLKNTSHEAIYRQIVLKEIAKKTQPPETLEDNLKGIPPKEQGKKNLEKERDLRIAPKIGTPFTRTYVMILLASLGIFSLALLSAGISPQLGILLFGGSLLLGVFGYMILFSRDITKNIYLEKISLSNVLLEGFQIVFMGLNLVMILIVGYSIDWFRYYLIESTFNFGDISIPRLFLSVIGVFFTSLVLVVISTYIQLKKTVKMLRNQRSQGASDNLLLYLKDQNSTRLITRLGYKTIVFLVSVLIGVISTTNLLTPETAFALLVVVIPFVLAGFSALILNRILEAKAKTKLSVEIHLPFIDSVKTCSKCKEQIYFSDKYCGICGAQQIFSEMIGTYIRRCAECQALINDKSTFCPNCGTDIKSFPSNN
ncbi:MAG: hypothetical protein EU544_03980, partial [Promethearchaeota archaeon]